MPSKNDYIRRILKSHGVIVDFDGLPNKINLPAKRIDKETFKQWKKRVLGDKVRNVVCYGPIEYGQQKTMDAIRDKANSSQIRTIMRSVRTAERIKADCTVRRVKIESNEVAIRVPMDDIEDIVKGLKSSLQLAVYDSIMCYIRKNKLQGNNLTIQELFSELLLRYNFAVATKGGRDGEA